MTIPSSVRNSAIVSLMRAHRNARNRVFAEEARDVHVKRGRAASGN
jgi:hypothetical protein